MQLRAAMSNTFTALLCAAILGCGGSSPSGPGTMSVRLVDGPDDLYDAVTLQVKKLEIHGPTGWETLADFAKEKNGVLEVNLLSLTGGVYQTLAEGKSLAAGHYDQMRMLLGPGNSVTPKDAKDPIPLKVPSGMQSGVKFPVSFDVAPGTTRDVYIDLDAHRSIFIHQAGNSGKYLLRPVIRAFDKLVTGSISGTLTIAGTTDTPATPLAGVDVMAEVVEGGHPVIVRTVKTNGSGQYVIDLVPLGTSYYVVTQPVVTTEGLTPTTTVYPPAASALLTVTEATPTPTWSHSFTAAAANAVGTVRGSITQPVTSTDTASVTSTDQTDTVYVLATFGTTRLAVRSKPAAFVEGAPTPETYQIDFLPFFDVGYTLAVERATGDGTGGTTTVWKTDTGLPFFATGAPAQLENRVLDLFP